MLESLKLQRGLWHFTGQKSNKRGKYSLDAFRKISSRGNRRWSLYFCVHLAGGSFWSYVRLNLTIPYSHPAHGSPALTSPADQQPWTDQQLEQRWGLEEYPSLNQNQNMLWGFESTVLHMLPCHCVIIPLHYANAFLCVIALTFHVVLNHIARSLGRRCRSVVKIISALKDAEVLGWFEDSLEETLLQTLVSYQF